MRLKARLRKPSELGGVFLERGRCLEEATFLITKATLTAAWIKMDLGLLVEKFWIGAEKT